MKPVRIVKGAVGCATVSALCIGSGVWAQDGGATWTFGIEQRFEHGRNLSLAVPAEGSSSIATTNLSFGLLRETQKQRFSVEATAGLRIADEAGSGSDVGLGDASLALSYARESANSELTLGLDLGRSEIGDLSAISGFSGSDGTIELPPDFADLTGTGLRNTYALSAGFETGRQSLIGFGVTAGLSGVEYQDATDPDLFDSRTSRLGAQVMLHASPRTTYHIGVDGEAYRADDADQTERDTTEVRIGVTHEASPRTRFDAALGYSDIHEVAGGAVTDTNGLVGSLGVAHDLPNGEVTARFEATRDSAGLLQTATVGRSLALPNGELSAEFGLSRTPGGDTEAIGSLSWSHETGPNTYSASLSREIATSADAEARATTVLDFSYQRELNAISRLSLNMAYAESEATPTEAEVKRWDLSAVYSRELTPDWDINTGVIYRTRDETGVGRAESPAVFVSLSRDFQARR